MWQPPLAWESTLVPDSTPFVVLEPAAISTASKTKSLDCGVNFVPGPCPFLMFEWSPSKTCWLFRWPRALLAVIKLVLFLLCFQISNSLFFAIFFGRDSCFFSRTGVKTVLAGYPRVCAPFYACCNEVMALVLPLSMHASRCTCRLPKCSYCLVGNYGH